MIPEEIHDHYSRGQEEHRLTRSAGRLEQLRTWEIMERHLPRTPARLLDVGGGTGSRATARANGCSACCGDSRTSRR
jgi:hypothetical protein